MFTLKLELSNGKTVELEAATLTMLAHQLYQLTFDKELWGKK